MTSRWVSVGVVSCGICLGSLSAQAEDLRLTCEEYAGDALAEARNIATTHGMVSRHGLHELRIRAAGRLIRLRDRPPYDESLDGTHYRYCGLHAGFHVIQVDDEALFGGVLVNTRDGKLLPGGETVLMTSDYRRYLAMVQPDGLDGQVWKIYQGNGKLLWSGYDFVPDAKREGYMTHQLQNPHWSVQRHLQAEAYCVDTKPETAWPVQLGDDGVWRPLHQCQATP